MTVQPHEIQGVYFIETDRGSRLATKNFTPGQVVYGERLKKVDNKEYRFWEPYRSKLAAGILLGVKLPQFAGKKVLYLGASFGTTSSHVSDLCGSTGHVYCVEFSKRVARKLLKVCETRSNMTPLICDARSPEEYSLFVPLVDIIFQDVAQPDQASILIRNSEYYLKSGGIAIMAIKSQSIDSTIDPNKVFENQTSIVTKAGFKLLEVLSIGKFEKDHALIVAQWAGKDPSQ
ncbi:MAG: fibrillarin-like rRNA/tRNA 2'-O-methyltransferase [Promethearchaeota archaeon]